MVAPTARPILLAYLIALATLVVSGGASPALGASFTVTATHDATDAAPGDGVCADSGNTCTLRAAVIETNALPGADEISLSAGTYPLSLAGAGENAAVTGDLDVTDSLTITGAGNQTTAIDAAQIDRVLHVSGPATELTISGITLTGGNLEPPFEPSSLCFPLHHGGGGVCITSGQLNLTDAEISGNHSDDHGGGILIGELGSLTAVSTDFHENSSLRSGGAFSNFGTATVSNASISGNAAPAGGGVRNTGEVPGVNGLLTIENTTVEGNDGSIGGGIDNGFGGHLTVDGSTIAGNEAATGGGIYNSGGIPGLQADHAEMTLRDIVVRGNSATFGGGIYNAGNDTPGIATIGGATIADNESSRFGGGMYNAGNLDLTASTISGNRAVLGGGGLFNAGGDVVPTGERAHATLMNVTVSSNDGGQTGGGISNRGAVTATNVTIAHNAAEIGGNVSRGGLDISEFKNTIFADPQSSTNCNAGSPLSLGHNLDSDGTCGLSAPGDISNVDPLLRPLADNGGPTQTHELGLPGSPAIDSGDNASCPATDQRGIPRPIDGNSDGSGVCDIGAFEQEPIVEIIEKCPGFCPETPTASPMPSPTPAAILPVTLPRTGGSAGPPSAIPITAAIWLVSAALAVAIARRVFTHH